jgi:hypothetical protein
MKKNNFVEFEVQGGYVELNYLRDKNNRKLYVDVESARAAGVANPETSDRVVRYLDGTPIGKVTLGEKSKRILKVPKEETAIIEALSWHEFVSSDLKPNSMAKITMRDLSKADEGKAENLQKQKIVDSVYINLEDEEIADLGVLLGYPADDANAKLNVLRNSKPDLFLSYFTEPLAMKGGKFYTAKLTEKTKVSAVLKRAVLAKVVTVSAGSISYEEEVLGIDFNTAVTNLMDTTKQGKSNILPLIKQKLSA